MLLLLAACKTKKETQKAVTLSKYKEWTDYERKSFDFAFFSAQTEKQKGNIEKAIDLFSQCLTIDTKNAPVMFELAQLYVNNNQISQALFYAKSAVEIDQENIWYKYLLANIFKVNGEFEKEIEVLKEILANKPSAIELNLSLSEAYLQNKNYQDALDQLGLIEKAIGLSPELSVQRQKIHIQKGDLEGAVAEVERLIKKFPEDKENYFMLGNLLAVNNKLEKAIQVYKDLLDKDGTDGKAHFSLFEIYKKQGKDQKSRVHLEEAFSGNFLSVEDKMKIVFGYYQLIEIDSSAFNLTNELVKKSLIQHPEEKGFHAIAGDMRLKEGDSLLAIDHYEKAYAYGLDDFNVLIQLMNLNFELKKYESVKKYAAEGVEKYPFQAVSYLYGGTVLSILEDYQGAIDYFEKGASYVFNNPDLQAQFYSSLGDAYHSLEKHQKSDEYYDMALEQKPNNALVLNNYAYYLSVRNVHLDKAKEMIIKALELEPESSSYRDTYGWILFKQGKYLEAIEWIKKSIEVDAQPSAEVYEHCGDALYKAGQVEEALKYWKLAKDAPGDISEFLNKKISTRQYYE